MRNTDIWVNGNLLDNSFNRIRNSNIDTLDGTKQHLEKTSTSLNLTIEKPCFYAGVFENHYGHFLLESLSRLSHYKNEDVLIWIHQDPSFCRDKFRDWQVELLTLLGLINKEHIFVRGKVTAKIANIPEREYIIWDKFSEKHCRYLEVIESQNKKYLNKKIWLSRRGFNSYLNEFILEQILMQKGWMIISLENLKVKEQAEIFNSAEKISGIEGTAFHGMLLSKKVCSDITIFSRHTILTRENQIQSHMNDNFKLISKVKCPQHKMVISKVKSAAIIDIEEACKELEIEMTPNDTLLVDIFETMLNMNPPHLIDLSEELISELTILRNKKVTSNIAIAAQLTGLLINARPNRQDFRDDLTRYQKSMNQTDMAHKNSQ